MMLSTSKKTKFAAIIAIVLLMSSALLMVIPVIAQDEGEHGGPPESVGSGISGPIPDGVTPEYIIPTEAHLSFRPNPVGIDQIFLVNIWTSPALHASRFHPNYTMTLTKPSGQVTTFKIDSYHADATAWFEWIADEVGEWTLRFDFLGTYFPSENVTGGFMEPPTVTLPSTYYEPSTSGDMKLVVQEDIVYPWPEPGPTGDYWTRPVVVEHREWWPILGNWPGTGYNGLGDPNWEEEYPGTNPHWSSQYKFTPWVQGPNSAHVIWKRQGDDAGIIGGQAGARGQIGAVPPTPDIIYNGKCYETYTKPGTGSEATSMWRCYDLRTGEIYWEYEPTTIQVPFFFFFMMDVALSPDTIEYASPTQSEVAGAEAAGGWSVNLIRITDNRLYKWDPWTGEMTANVTAMDGTFYQSSYARDTEPTVLSVQNIGNQTNPEYRLIKWTTRGSTDNFESRVLSNTSYARSSLPSYIDFNVGLGANVNPISTAGVWTGMSFIGYNLTTGEQLWDTEITDEPMYSPVCTIADHGKVATVSGHGYYVAVDLATGNIAWKGEKMNYPWAAAGFGAYSAMSGYGMLFRESMDGIYAYNWTNGEIVWKYEAIARSQYESPYTAGNNTRTVYPFYSFGGGGLIADGKFYTWNYEHTESYPITRGWSIHAIDVFTGEKVWSMLGTMVPGAIADGYLVASSRYDGYTYCFGKGKTETTVNTPDTAAVPKGTAMTITGSVLDMSPAQLGTPCVSEDSMQTQMEYIHMQMPIDGIWHNETITGVPVTLTAIKDGTYYDIGTATTSGYYGTFGISWTPPEEGLYEIIASFEGSEGYGSSGDSTWVTVGPAPSPAQPQTEEPTTEAPTTEAPTTEAPTTEAPTTEAPTTEALTSEVPTTEQPSGEAPGFPTTEVIIIAAVAVAIVIGVGAYWALRRQK
jgi:hypothetical protein